MKREYPNVVPSPNGSVCFHEKLTSFSYGSKNKENIWEMFSSEGGSRLNSLTSSPYKPFDDALKALRRSIKASEDRPTTHYIWHTVGDSRTRQSHRDNDGKIFAWDDPPETGHPGEDYGCRCKAEPYYGDVEVSGLEHLSTDSILDVIRRGLFGISRWNSFVMLAYFFVANRAVTLREIGHFPFVKDFYERHYRIRFVKYIFNQTKNVPDGPIYIDFERPYQFSWYVFAYGKATVRGEFTGTIHTLDSGERMIDGSTKYQFYDIFEDPLDIAQALKSSTRFASLIDQVAGEGSARYLIDNADIGGTPYAITDTWDEEMKEFERRLVVA